MKPILSIVIPTYNRCDYLKECLNSIKNCSKSTQKKIELIISDNNSQDQTQKVIESFILSNHSLYEIVNLKSNKLISAQDNWKIGIDQATAHHVLILSDDDKLHNLGFEKIINEEIFINYSLFIGGHIVIDNKGNELAKYNNKIKNYNLEKLLRDLSFRKIRHKLCSVIWEKKMVSDLKVFSEKYPSNGICLDGAIILAAASNDNILCSNKIISEYRVHLNNDCRGKDTMKFLKGREIFHRFGKKIISKKVKAFYWFILWNIYGGIIQSIASIFRLGEFKTARKMLNDTYYLQNKLINNKNIIKKNTPPGIILLSIFYLLKILKHLRLIN